MQKKIYAVIGNPVRHSKSPEIYNYLFEKYGINSTYIFAELTENLTADFLQIYAPAMNIAGINVTMPLKSMAAKLAKELDPASSLLESVNTLDLTTGKGYTTDGKGLLLSLEFQGFNPREKNVIVLGAGGAARSIVYELEKTNPSSLIVLNRTYEKAQELAAKIGGVVNADSLANIKSYTNNCDLLINCTSMGMTGSNPMDLTFLSSMKKAAFVYDIIYEPKRTELLKASSRYGFCTCNGLDMLICQAFYAFNIFTGIMPDRKDRTELLNILN